MKKMSDDLGIFPFQAHGEPLLFLARFEWPNFGEDYQISKSAWRALATQGVAPPKGTEAESVGFIHFLSGFPIDTVEMLMLIGEFSSKSKDGSKVNTQDGKGKCFSPVWKKSKIFSWPDKEKLLLNKTALKEFGSLYFAKNLPGEPKPKSAHWWFRVELVAGVSPNQFPVPGEFLGLGVRMMPGEYWGRQKSSPFIYSGNWMDTAYLSGGRIKEVHAPTGCEPYSTYSVQWRREVFKARSSDFAEYREDDRVTILKDVATRKKTQLWKDDDMLPDCVKETWQIVPISFYGFDKPE